jgi:hypothetical protein
MENDSDDEKSASVSISSILRVKKTYTSSNSSQQHTAIAKACSRTFKQHLSLRIVWTLRAVTPEPWTR